MFFDRFRDAVGRLPAGLIRPGPPATEGAIAAAEAALGLALPAPLASFLRSFDGADLFHESVVIAGVGPAAPRQLVALNTQSSPPPPSGRRADVVFAEALSGDRFALDGGGRVVRLRAGDDRWDERWIAGSDLPRWLDALVAHERLLYGDDGEFLPDAFEDDGTEVVPVMALRQAERALRVDPGSAELEHQRGVALRRLGRVAPAEAAFRAAATLDPGNPWPWFDLGRAGLARGAAGARDALHAFRRAAAAEPVPATAARLWVWAARAALLAALPDDVEGCRGEARARAPALADELAQALEAAHAGESPEEIAEAEALLAALVGDIPRGRARLAVITGAPEAPAARARPRDQAAARPGAKGAAPPGSPARPRPPRDQRRPRRAGPPPAGGSRPGRRR